MPFCAAGLHEPLNRCGGTYLWSGLHAGVGDDDLACLFLWIWVLGVQFKGPWCLVLILRVFWIDSDVEGNMLFSCFFVCVLGYVILLACRCAISLAEARWTRLFQFMVIEVVVCSCAGQEETKIGTNLSYFELGIMPSKLINHL